jgi:hypothetical protein
MLYVTVFDIKRFSLFRMMFKRQTQIEQTEQPAESVEQGATNPAQ